MSDERYTPESWRRQYSPVADWDETFRNRQWDALGSLKQTARHAIVAGYVHKLVGRGHVLDAGCGEGVLIEYFDHSRIDYTGFDISPTAIERARERYPEARLFSCSIEGFAPPDGTVYDAIVFNDSLASLEGPIETIDRYYSYLRPGGHIVVSQFQPPIPQANGTLFTRVFETELAAGRYNLVAKSEVTNCDTGQKWRSYCLLAS